MGPGQGLSPFSCVRGISLLSPSFPYKTYFQLENFPPENCSLRAGRLLQPPKGLWWFNLLSLKMKLCLQMPWTNNSDPGIVCPRTELFCAHLPFERNPQPPRSVVQSSFFHRIGCTNISQIKSLWQRNWYFEDSGPVSVHSSLSAAWSLHTGVVLHGWEHRGNFTVTNSGASRVSEPIRLDST